MKTTEIIERIKNGNLDEKLLDIYVDEAKLDYQKSRYIKAIEKFVDIYHEKDVEIYSAPGRSEIGGNHTDHQHGEVLATSINDDAIAITVKSQDNNVYVVSGEDEMLVVSLDDYLMKEDEAGTTISLIKGVIRGFADRKYKIGGFKTYITSDVLIGAGLSSSAAFETVIGTILSGLFNNMEISATEIAIIGQYAENVYFGKPCGLMDQMACSVGNLVHIDFKDTKNPVVEKIEFDMNKHGYCLCITDTKGSHADLTADYAAIPIEMKKIARHFDKEVLIDVPEEKIIENIAELRSLYGDRAVLRALHFTSENVRVQKEVQALKDEKIDEFFSAVKESGNSSFKYLQNVYTNLDVEHQNVSVALAISELALGNNGVSRVHGGGFAGTMQAFVENSHVGEYQKMMNHVFGEGSCKVLKIRKYGGMKVI